MKRNIRLRTFVVYKVLFLFNKLYVCIMICVTVISKLKSWTSFKPRAKIKIFYFRGYIYGKISEVSWNLQKIFYFINFTCANLLYSGLKYSRNEEIEGINLYLKFELKWKFLLYGILLDGKQHATKQKYFLIFENII